MQTPPRSLRNSPICSNNRSPGQWSSFQLSKGSALLCWNAPQSDPRCRTMAKRRDELKDHCAICGQWTAKRGCTKLHMQANHSEEWSQAEELAKAKCLQCRHMVDHSTGCQFCGEPRFADKRAAVAHAQHCQVLFQIVLLQIMQEEKAGPCQGLSSRAVQLRAGEVIEIPAVPESTELTRDQRQFLAKHCVICKQYLPDPKSFKQRIKKKRPSVRVTEADLKPNCKRIIQVKQGKCSHCERDVTNV